MKSDRELLQVLCPFGEWPHAKGMQVVDEESARKMKRAAAWSAAVGIPIYVGHPDDEGIRAEAVGRIKRICPTNDGIAVVAAYPQKTYEKIVRGEFSAMSPRWRMQKLGDRQIPPREAPVGGSYEQPEHFRKRKNSRLRRARFGANCRTLARGDGENGKARGGNRNLRGKGGVAQKKRGGGDNLGTAGGAEKRRRTPRKEAC